MPDTSKPRTIPRRSDDELASLATVDDESVADAVGYWREHAAEKWKTILDATEGDGEK